MYKINISKTENIVLKKLEKIFQKKIIRQFQLENKYYDGKYKKYLIEVDGLQFHSKIDDLKNDIYKNKLAKKNGYKVIRLLIPSIKDINRIIQINYPILKEIFYD